MTGPASREPGADPKVIPIWPWLTPSLVPDEPAQTGTPVIPIRSGMFPRAARRPGAPHLQVRLAGICWVVVAVL